MSIYINKDTKVITQGITGKTGQFHTEKCQEYANGKNCFVAGVNPKKAGESIFNIPIYASVKEAATQTGATVSVIYVPPAGAAAAIWAIPRWRAAAHRDARSITRAKSAGRCLTGLICISKWTRCAPSLWLCPRPPKRQRMWRQG